MTLFFADTAHVVGFSAEGQGDENQQNRIARSAKNKKQGCSSQQTQLVTNKFEEETRQNAW